MKFTTFLLPFLMMVPAGATSCSVSYYVYPSGTYDPNGGTLLSNGGDIATPPCSANIEARVTGCAVSGSVKIKLFKNGSYVTSRTEHHDPRFLYGDSDGKVYEGTIPGPGEYTIKTEVNGLWIGKLHFTISGNCDGVPDPSCTVTYKLWNPHPANTFYANLEAVVDNPPCEANIEAVVPDGCNAEGTVTIELYDDNNDLVEDRGENADPYFLGGNDFSNPGGALKVYDDDIPGNGDYSIRTRVNGDWTTEHDFKLTGGCHY